MKIEDLQKLTSQLTTMHSTVILPMVVDGKLILKANALAYKLPKVPKGKIPVIDRGAYRVALRAYERILLRWASSVKKIRLARGEVGCAALRDLTADLGNLLIQLQGRL